jgi:hypothetical protein
MADKEDVINVLNEDKSYIQDILNSNLYELPDVIKKQWQEDLPYIKSEIPNIECISLSMFKTKFFSIFPKFVGFNFSNILIAGGSICDIVIGRDNKINDVDIFIYGLTKEEANKRVFEIINWFEQFNKSLRCVFKENYVSFRTETLTFENNLLKVKSDIKIQIIFKLYASINEILLSFDLGASGIGFDGKKIYMTPLAKFAYETGYNIISLDHESLSYEYRIFKYMKKGFGIILPNLNITNEIKLPRLPLLFLKEKNKLVFETNQYNEFMNNLKETSGYDDKNDIDNATITTYYQKPNILKLLNGKILHYYVNNQEFPDRNPYTEQFLDPITKKFIRFYPKMEGNNPLSHLQNDMYLLDENKINLTYNKLTCDLENLLNFFKNLKNKSPDRFYTLFESRKKRLFNKIFRYFNKIDTEKMIENITISLQSYAVMFKKKSDLQFNEFKMKLQNQINEQKKKVVELYKKYIKIHEPQIIWKEREIGEQMIAPFKPVKFSHEAWYGKYYIKFLPSDPEHPIIEPKIEINEEQIVEPQIEINKEIKIEIIEEQNKEI